MACTIGLILPSSLLLKPCPQGQGFILFVLILPGTYQWKSTTFALYWLTLRGYNYSFIRYKHDVARMQCRTFSQQRQKQLCATEAVSNPKNPKYNEFKERHRAPVCIRVTVCFCFHKYIPEIRLQTSNLPNQIVPLPSLHSPTPLCSQQRDGKGVTLMHTCSSFCSVTRLTSLPGNGTGH